MAETTSSAPEPEPAPPPNEGAPAAPSPAERLLVERPLVGPYLHLVTAALTGLLYFLAFPGVGAWPLAFVAWTPWILGLRGRSPRQAVLGGLVVGLIVSFFGFYWLLEMLETFSGFGRPLCLVFMTLLCAYQAGRFMLLGWLYTRGRARGHWPGLVFVLAFLASETLYPMLFPFYFGATLHGVPALIQLAEWGGPLLIALTLLATSWALALLLEAALDRKHEGEPLSLQFVLGRVGGWRLGLLASVPILSALYGALRIQQIDAEVERAEKLKVGIVQANMGLTEKRKNQDEGKRRHLKLTRQLRKEKVELVVWPETSISGAVSEEYAEQYYKQALTRHLKVPTIFGAVLSRRVDDERGYVLFNSALFADETGEISGRYDKQFPLAFGEYLPLGDKFPQLYEYSPNSGRFTPGTSWDPVVFRGKPISVFICYEDIIPSFVNELVQHGDSQLLVNMTNDAWFGDSTEPWEHMALSQLRAVEQRRFFVRATNSGISGFVDPVGRLLQKTPTFEPAAISQEVAWLDLWTPYRFLGDVPFQLATGASILLAFMRRRRATS